MRIATGINAAKCSQQEDFKKEIQCECGKTAHVIFGFMEDVEGGNAAICNMQHEKLLCLGNRSNKSPHDLIGCAIYLCPDCGKSTSLWNQA